MRSKHRVTSQGTQVRLSVDTTRRLMRVLLTAVYYAKPPCPPFVRIERGYRYIRGLHGSALDLIRLMPCRAGSRRLTREDVVRADPIPDT